MSKSPAKRPGSLLFESPGLPSMHICFWRLADIPDCAAHVRFGVKADMDF